MSQETVSLIEDRELTVLMLADPLQWRVRVVEEISVDAASTCLRGRSLQVAPLRELLGAKAPSSATHALLALYVAPIPRGPLLDFDVSGPDGDAWLLPRLEIAARQASYLAGLVEASGGQVGSELHALLTAICGFTGELVVRDQPLAQYLEEGLGRPVAAATVAQWQTFADDCQRALRPRLDVFRGYSAPENPVLVLPGMFDDTQVADDKAATDLLALYRDLLVAMNSRAGGEVPNAADEFLVALADYANNYDLMVGMRVPLDEPFLVKYAERRDMNLSPWHNRGTQELVVADARTNHVTFKVSDPNVRIRDFRARKPGTQEYSFGLFQSRSDPQNRAFYAHQPDRDYRVRLSFQLGVLLRLQLVPYMVAVLLVLLTAALLTARPTDLRTLALIAGPAALAASVLLAREPSTLGSRLRVVSSVCVAAAVTVLIAASVCLFLSGPRAAGPAPECECATTTTGPAGGTPPVTSRTQVPSGTRTTAAPPRSSRRVPPIVSSTK